MIFIGEMPDGRKIMQTHGGRMIETIEQRDRRRAEEAHNRRCAAAADMEQALKEARGHLLALEKGTALQIESDGILAVVAKIDAVLKKAKGET